jgi:hypothetical protein
MTEKQLYRVPLRWVVDPHLVSRYANNVIVQHTPDEFVLNFFEARPPLRLEADGQLPEVIEAYCVARIILSPAQMESLLTVLQENFNDFLRIQEMADEDAP